MPPPTGEASPHHGQRETGQQGPPAGAPPPTRSLLSSAVSWDPFRGDSDLTPQGASWPALLCTSMCLSGMPTCLFHGAVGSLTWAERALPLGGQPCLQPLLHPHHRVAPLLGLYLGKGRVRALQTVTDRGRERQGGSDHEERWGPGAGPGGHRAGRGYPPSGCPPQPRAWPCHPPAAPLPSRRESPSPRLLPLHCGLAHALRTLPCFAG